jgi:hypothetical protein
MPIISRSSAVQDRQYATMLNLVLPGVGQFYLGQRVLGCAFAGGSLACFVAAVVVFIVGIKRCWKLASSGDLLEGRKLEQMREAMHPGQLFILVGVVILMYVLSIAALRLVPPRGRHKPDATMDPTGDTQPRE